MDYFNGCYLYFCCKNKHNYIKVLFYRLAKQDFEDHSIVTGNVVVHSNCDSPFSSVIINSRNGSRTIIHSNKNMPELKLSDFKRLNLSHYKWVHFEASQL